MIAEKCSWQMPPLHWPYLLLWLVVNLTLLYLYLLMGWLVRKLMLKHLCLWMAQLKEWITFLLKYNTVKPLWPILWEISTSSDASNYVVEKNCSLHGKKEFLHPLTHNVVVAFVHITSSWKQIVCMPSEFNVTNNQSSKGLLCQHTVHTWQHNFELIPSLTSFIYKGRCTNLHCVLKNLEKFLH